MCCQGKEGEGETDASRLSMVSIKNVSRETQGSHSQRAWAVNSCGMLLCPTMPDKCYIQTPSFFSRIDEVCF